MTSAKIKYPRDRGSNPEEMTFVAHSLLEREVQKLRHSPNSTVWITLTTEEVPAVRVRVRKGGQFDLADLTNVTLAKLGEVTGNADALFLGYSFCYRGSRWSRASFSFNAIFGCPLVSHETMAKYFSGDVLKLSCLIIMKTAIW